MTDTNDELANLLMEAVFSPPQTHMERADFHRRSTSRAMEAVLTAGMRLPKRPSYRAADEVTHALLGALQATVLETNCLLREIVARLPEPPKEETTND